VVDGRIVSGRHETPDAKARIGIREKLDIRSRGVYHTHSNPRGFLNERVRNVSIGQGGLLHDVELDCIYGRCVGELKRLAAAAAPDIFTSWKPHCGPALCRAVSWDSTFCFFDRTGAQN
jgi:hypothetical protein